MNEMDELIEDMARAILKTRFYDCEPEMYASLDEFYLEIDPDHWIEARAEARAAYDSLLAMGAIREPRTIVEQIHDVTDAIMRKE